MVSKNDCVVLVNEYHKKMTYSWTIGHFSPVAPTQLFSLTPQHRLLFRIKILFTMLYSLKLIFEQL